MSHNGVGIALMLFILRTIYISAAKTPFIVSIQRGLTNGSYEHICVGSILSKNVVLTAAHCFIKYNNSDELSVVSSKYIMKPKGNGYTRHHVIRIRSHEKFYPLKGYDVALIKVDPFFILDNIEYGKIRFILDGLIKPDNLKGFLAGWGRLKDLRATNSELVPFNGISTERCAQKYHHLTPTEFCAFGNGYRGACNGESGAPLLTHNLKVQYGVLSYAKTKCTAKAIYVFTRLPELHSWINRTLNNI